MKQLILILILALCSILTGYGQIGSKPNIIIIVADDLGWGDVGYHNSDIKTPHLDRLSREGIRLSRFYVAPVCSPTRAGLLTGRYPNRFGLRENVIPPWRDFGLDPSEELLPELLARAGYRNRAILGKWHLGHSKPDYYPLRNGFTHFYGHLNGAIDYFSHKREEELDWHDDYQSSYDKGHATDLLTGDAIKSIRDYADEGPFFIYLAYNAPHSPLQATSGDLARYGYDASRPAFSDNGKHSKGRGNTRRQTFAAMVTGMDRGIGRIIKALEEEGIAENTLILFFSDNGPNEEHGGGSAGPLRGHKFQEWEGGVRAPALIKWPEGFKGGRKLDQVTGFVDVMPTISGIVSPGYAPERSWDGINILPVLRGEVREIDRYMYLGAGAIVSNTWKYIEAGRNRKMDLKGDVLFRISDDPYEKNNVLTAYPAVADELRKAMLPYDTLRPKQVVLPYHVGRKGFVAPEEWNLFKESTK